MSNIELESVDEIKINLQKEQEKVDHQEDHSAPDENINSQSEIQDLDNQEQNEEEENKISSKDLKKRVYENLGQDEKEAWAQGWRPKELDKGKNRDGSDRKWLTAEEFLEKSQKALPVANDRIRELSKRVEKAEKEAMEAKSRILKAEERGYEKALKEITAKQRDAVEIGDIESFDILKQEELELLDSIRTKPEAINETPKEEEAVVESVVQEDSYEKPQELMLSHQDQQTLAQWQARNQWMSTDPKLSAYAIESEKILLKEQPYLSLAERLELVEEEVKEVFYNKFNPKPKKSMFGSGGNAGYGGNEKAPKGYSQLPDQAKKTCDQVMRMRDVASKGEEAIKSFKQTWAAAYFNN